MHADDARPGIARVKRGRGVAYVDQATGAAVRDQVTLDRIRALAIPPAWTAVWICADPHGHLQATGRDAKGRKQYRYHPTFREHRETTKFSELVGFGAALPRIRRRVAADLAKRGVPKEKVVATVVRLLEATLVRVGNEEYARANGSYGLTTLRDRHARWQGDGSVALRFVGKHGKEHRVEVRDTRIAKIVRRCRDLPGQVLFQYEADDGPVPVTSGDVNDYLRGASGTALSAKDFRTWMASLLAASALARQPAPESERAAASTIKSACEEVSHHLGNTPAVCKASYIHPAVFDAYRDGTLRTAWQSPAPQGPAGLVADERRLLALLRAAGTTGTTSRTQSRVDASTEEERNGRAHAAHRSERRDRALRGGPRRATPGSRRPHADAGGRSRGGPAAGVAGGRRALP